MNSQTIMCCVVALILGMLLANMLKNVCGCKNVVEGLQDLPCPDPSSACLNDYIGEPPDQIYTVGRLQYEIEQILLNINNDETIQDFYNTYSTNQDVLADRDPDPLNAPDPLLNPEDFPGITIKEYLINNICDIYFVSSDTIYQYSYYGLWFSAFAYINSKNFYEAIDQINNITIRAANICGDDATLTIEDSGLQETTMGCCVQGSG